MGNIYAKYILNESFELTAGDHEDLVIQCQQLRYRVYCEQEGWYDQVIIEGDREVDPDYDHLSQHILLVHTPTGTPVGACRVILSEPDRSLPIRLLDPDPTAQVEQLQTRRVGEISRLAVLQDFRGKPHGTDRAFGVKASVGLVAGIFAVAMEFSVFDFCTMMEPRMCVYFNRMHFPFHVIGEPIVYHGRLRQPCWINYTETETALLEHAPITHEYIFVH